MYPPVSTGAAAGNSATPAQRHTLSNALGEHGQTLGALHGFIDELEARIRPILDPPRQPPPPGSSNLSKDPTGPLELVTAHTIGLQQAISRLREITDRIHL